MLELAIQARVERRLDPASFGSRSKNEETGCPAYDPQSLLKVILVASARGLSAARKIEQAWREHLTCMAVAGGAAPAHRTLAAFVASLQEALAALLRAILLVCVEQDLLGGPPFALAGVKLRATAAKAWSGTVADWRRKKDK